MKGIPDADVYESPNSNSGGGCGGLVLSFLVPLFAIGTCLYIGDRQQQKSSEERQSNRSVEENPFLNPPSDYRIPILDPNKIERDRFY